MSQFQLNTSSKDIFKRCWTDLIGLPPLDRIRVEVLGDELLDHQLLPFVFDDERAVALLQNEPEQFLKGTRINNWASPAGLGAAPL